MGYGDVIDVKFFYNENLNETLTIRPDGRITLPRLGDVLIVGMTPTQLDQLITEKYSEIVRGPDVTVIVREIGEEVVYVLGEVNDPGGYPLNPSGTTVLGAISLASGFKHTAKLSSIILIKKNAQGVPVASRVNLQRKSIRARRTRGRRTLSSLPRVTGGPLKKLRLSSRRGKQWVRWPPKSRKSVRTCLSARSRPRSPESCRSF